MTNSLIRKRYLLLPFVILHLTEDQEMTYKTFDIKRHTVSSQTGVCPHTGVSGSMINQTEVLTVTTVLRGPDIQILLFNRPEQDTDPRDSWGTDKLY